MAAKIFKNPYFYLGAAGVVAMATTAVVLAERTRKRKEVSKILSILEGREGATGTIQDLGGSGNAFDRNYWKSQRCGVVLQYGNILDRGDLSITVADARKYAEQIYNAKKGLLGSNRLWDNENEGLVLNIFRSLKSKCDVSALSDYFYQKYNRDLLEYLKFVDKGQNSEILFDIINKLP